MGILSKAKAKLKSVVSTTATKIGKAVGLGSGGGGGGSWSAPKTSNVDSVVQAKPSSGKIVMPTSPAAGPQSTIPNPGKQTLNQTVNNLISTQGKGPVVNQSVIPKNQSTIPSPSSKQIVTDPKTGKTSMVDVTKPKIDVQGIVDKATGGKSGGQSRMSSTGADISTPLNGVETVSSFGAGDQLFGLGDIEAAATDAFSSASAPSSASSPSSPSSYPSKGSGSSGGSGSSAPTSQRGANVQSARDQAIASAKAEAERLAKEVGLLSAKDESAAADAVVTDTTETQSETDAFNYLKEQPDNSALKLIDEEIKNLKQNPRENEKSIGKAYDVKQTGMEVAQANETGQASVGIANAGGYLGFSGSGQGVMLSLAESHRAELVSLESERQQALQEARNAAATRRYDIVRLKANEIARIDQEKYERTKEYNAEVKKEADKTKEEAKKLRTQNDILTAIKGGAKTVESIFNELGGRVDINDIEKTLEAISGGDEGSFKFSATQTAGLLGAGMGMADIKTLNEYVSENGYDDNIKKLLTPAQRKAADKIFTTGAIGSGGSYDFTDQENRKLEQAGLLNAPRQDQLDYLYGGSSDEEKPYDSIYTGQILEGKTTVESVPLEIQEDVRKELYNLGFGTDVVPQWYKDYIEAKGLQTYTADTLKNNWSTFRKTALGEAITDEGDGSWWSIWTNK